MLKKKHSSQVPAADALDRHPARYDVALRAVVEHAASDQAFAYRALCGDPADVLGAAGQGPLAGVPSALDKDGAALVHDEQVADGDESVWPAFELVGAIASRLARPEGCAAISPPRCLQRPRVPRVHRGAW